MKYEPSSWEYEWTRGVRGQIADDGRVVPASQLRWNRMVRSDLVDMSGNDEWLLVRASDIPDAGNQGEEHSPDLCRSKCKCLTVEQSAKRILDDGWEPQHFHLLDEPEKAFAGGPPKRRAPRR